MLTALKELHHAPMLCVLFLAVKMRANQLGFQAPQTWACAFICIATGAVLLHVILVASGAAADGGIKVLAALESVMAMPLLVSTAAVVVSMLLIEPKDGPTPVVPTTLRIVMGLTMVYFIIHSFVWISQKLYELKFITHTLFIEMFEAAVDAVMFCPMLCTLFMATKMQALQLYPDGVPQGWAQDFMVLASSAVIFHLGGVLLDHAGVMEHAFVSPFHSAAKVLLEHSGKKGFSKIVFQGMCMAALHSSTVAVIISVFLQTPENTNPVVASSSGLIPGFKMPGRV